MYWLLAVNLALPVIQWLGRMTNLVGADAPRMGADHVAGLGGDHLGSLLSGLFTLLSPGGLFAVLMIFVLARIFRHGSEMRADLEGTV